METWQRDGPLLSEPAEGAPESVKIVEEVDRSEHPLAEGVTARRKRRRFIVVEECEEEMQEHPQNVDDSPEMANLNSDPPRDTKPSDYKCGTPYVHSTPKKEGHDYWGDLLKPLQDSDAAQCKIWEGEVQNILIFASLFSAVVTAFVIESYKSLKPDPNEAAILLLTRIVTLLDSAVNGSTSTLSPDEPIPFRPSLITVNAFWILSLITSLTTLLVGIVASQWLREHQVVPDHFSAEEKFGLLSMRTEMIKKWHLSIFIESLPFLLELAFMLFLLGLAKFLRSLGVLQMTIPSIIAIYPSLLFLLATTTIPALQILTVRSTWTQMNKDAPVPCPYKSPQSRLFRLLISSRLGDLFARCILIPAWAIATQSVRGVRSLYIAGQSAILCSSRMEYLRKCFQRGETLIFYPLKFIPGCWRQRLANIYPPSYPGYNPVTAKAWIDLDMEWISLRRNYCSKSLMGPSEIWRGGRFKKDLGYGPLYDHLLGIQNVCSRFAQYPALLQSGYHCFLDCISSKDMKPGQPSLDYGLLWYGKDYYKAVVEMLSLRGTVLIADLVQQPPTAELMYDQALLLFVERFAPALQFTRRELTHRTLNYFIENHTSEQVDNEGPLWGLTYFKSNADDFFCECLEHTNEDDQCAAAKYLSSFFANMPKGAIDWTPHRIFGLYLNRPVAAYIRFCLKSTTHNGGVIERAADWLSVKLRCSPEPRADHDSERTAAHVFLTSLAVAKGHMTTCRRYGLGVPLVILTLAATLKDKIANMISHPGEPLNKGIIMVAMQLWGYSKEDIMIVLKDDIADWEKYLALRYQLHSAQQGITAGASSEKISHPAGAFPPDPSDPVSPIPPDAETSSIDEASLAHEVGQDDNLKGTDPPLRTRDTVRDEYSRAEAGAQNYCNIGT